MTCVKKTLAMQSGTPAVCVNLPSWFRLDVQDASSDDVTFLLCLVFFTWKPLTLCPPLDSISIKSCSQLPQWDLPGQFLLHIWSPRLPVFNDVVLFFALSIRLLQSSQLL